MSHTGLVARTFVSTHPDDAARILEGFSSEQVGAYLRELDVPTAAGAARQLAPYLTATCLVHLEPETAARILTQLPWPLAASVMRRVPEPERPALLDALAADVRRRLQTLLQYAEHSAAALMDADVFILFGDATAQEALRSARKNGRRLSHHIPVLDRDHRLQGAVTLQVLLLADGKETVDKVATREFGTVGPDAHLKRVVTHPLWPLYRELFVIDSEGMFMGVLRFESLAGMESGVRDTNQAGAGLATGRALSELFWIGLSALVTVAAGLAKPREEHSNAR